MKAKLFMLAICVAMLMGVAQAQDLKMTQNFMGTALEAVPEKERANVKINFAVIETREQLDENLSFALSTKQRDEAASKACFTVSNVPSFAGVIFCNGFSDFMKMSVISIKPGILMTENPAVYVLAAKLAHEIAHLRGGDEVAALECEIRVLESFVKQKRIGEAGGRDYVVVLKKDLAEERSARAVASNPARQ